MFLNWDCILKKCHHCIHKERWNQVVWLTACLRYERYIKRTSNNITYKKWLDVENQEILKPFFLKKKVWNKGKKNLIRLQFHGSKFTGCIKSAAPPSWIKAKVEAAAQLGPGLRQSTESRRHRCLKGQGQLAACCEGALQACVLWWTSQKAGCCCHYIIMCIVFLCKHRTKPQLKSCWRSMARIFLSNNKPTANLEKHFSYISSYKSHLWVDSLAATRPANSHHIN